MVFDTIDELNKNLTKLRTELDDQSEEIGQAMSQASAGAGPSSSPFLVTETAQLDHPDVDNSGAMVIQPGETKTVVEYEVATDVGFLLALGATDSAPCTYTLRVDNTPRFTTSSPLGLVNSPFSLEARLGYIYPAADLIEYRVTLDANADSEERIAGRMFVTEEVR